ncbi:MAG: prepilin-type N-terminal cleavage/methylation domain-containing protein [Patescibacteria group bacterium]
MKLFSKIKFRKNSGFTIIELIIAIFILSFSIFGVYNAFITVIVLTHGVSDRFIGAYLAQEGLEIIRNTRDTNWISGSINWRQGLQDCQDGCEADYTTGTNLPGAKSLTPWVGGNSGGVYLKINNNGFYNYASGQDTNFKRKITITFLGNYIMKVFVSVSWKEKANVLNPTAEPGIIEAEETLYNWY